MNAQQTKAEAQRQICLLMLHSTPEERERLRKYLKPVPELPVQRRKGEPKHISEILPGVMADIRRRMERRGVEV